MKRHKVFTEYVSNKDYNTRKGKSFATVRPKLHMIYFGISLVIIS